MVTKSLARDASINNTVVCVHSSETLIMILLDQKYASPSVYVITSHIVKCFENAKLFYNEYMLN